MTADNQVTLGPCPNPWCNSHKSTDCEIRAAEAPILMPSKASSEWAVACPVCPIQTPWFDSEAEARAAWNTRTQPAINSGGEVERISDALLHSVETYEGVGTVHPSRKQREHMARAALAAMDHAPGVEGDLAACNRAIDRMGWPEIHAFMNEPAQSPREDAGGYMLRKIKALFGIKPDRLETYKEAARRLIAEAQQNTQPEPRPVEAGEVANAIALIDELNERAKSRQFYGISQTLHAKLCTIRGTLEKSLDQSTHRQQSFSAARAEGQEEGKRAVLNWLRERSAMKPPATLWSAAEILADQFEASEIPTLSTDQGREGEAHAD